MMENDSSYDSDSDLSDDSDFRGQGDIYYSPSAANTTGDERWQRNSPHASIDDRVNVMYERNAEALASSFQKMRQSVCPQDQRRMHHVKDKISQYHTPNLTNYALEQGGQQDKNDMSPINLQRLRRWADYDNYTILVFDVSTNLTAVVQLLERGQLPAEWTFYLLTILKKMSLAHSQKISVDLIFRSLIISNFLDSHLRYFFQQLGHNRTLRHQAFNTTQNVFDIIEYIMENFHEHLTKCYSCLCMIKEEGKQINLLGEGDILTVRYSNLLRKAEKNFPQFTQHQAVKQQRKKEIPRADEEVPPGDFSEMKIFPDLEELEASYEPFLWANKTSGPYRDVRHYTDVHFRLLREDYLSPIRTGLKDFKEALQENKKVSSQELRFYFEVQLVQMKSDDKNGITFMVKFSLEDLKDVRWEFSRRFMNGALVCFSKDNFETVIFATVANQDHEVQSRGQVQVIFESNLEEVFTSSEYDVYVMAETVSFFESYRHVLEGLQEVQQLPLESYIVHCRKHIQPPQYIDGNTCFNLSPVIEGHKDRKVNLLGLDWPDPTQTVLNDSQLDALKLALTQELAVIQGPPGTGKTYVGLKIMEVFLKNRQEVRSFEGPILVVCYTNHALDQFLEGILEFCRNGIVRVGGRSKSEALKRFNLNELTKSHILSRFIKKSVDQKLFRSRRKLKETCRRIRTLWQESLKLDTTVLSLDDLEDEIDFLHLTSLTDKTRSNGGRSKVVSQWMKAASADMERHINEAAKKHLTKMIVADGDIFEDNGLLSKKGMMRPDFETRTRIYRGWLQKLHTDLEERWRIALGQRNNQTERLINEILEQKEETSKDILPDDVIKKYMSSPEVFESVKKCVEVECGEHFQSSYIKSWLLGYFCSSDQILDAISRLSKIANNCSSKPKNNYEAEEKRHPWVIGDSDDSDDDSDLGFNMRRDANNESSDDASDEAAEETSEFQALEAEFKYSERKEVLLLQRAKLLGINLTEETESLEEWQTNDRMTYSKVFRLIRNQEPYSEEDVLSINDVWALSLPERYRLYKYWMLKKKAKIARTIIELTQAYNHFLKMKRQASDTKRNAILRGAQVIGMTTTGAAKNRKILKHVAPQIIIVEEAAEVLEAHIITTLNKNCKHLILIGDHQQLRPNPTVHRLAKDYDLEISLFERLVKNDLPMVVLAEQHRMRPEVADYLRLIYPHLRDHETVLSYNDVRGISSNVFFLHHEFEERNVLDSTSKENIHEAEFLKELCNYFMQQGYLGRQMTILAAYSGQVNILREIIQNNNSDTFQDLKITSIDNYQGEENDIILLSLVRSNIVEEVGFLKSMNRVCVALSRARRGLFVIGNFLLLAGQSRLWKRIVDMARRTGAYGNFMKLPCVNHSGHFTFVNTAKDFQAKVPEGGCNLPCNAQLACGHLCPRLCHASDPDHQFLICYQPCLKTCSKGHDCQKDCHQECGLCCTLVEKKLTLCGHADLVHCYEDENTAFCNQQCGHKLSCGHICKGRCGDCLKSGEHEPCQEKVLLEWPCSHKGYVECYIDVKQHPCPSKCKEILNCGHRCSGSCGECLSGRVHKICTTRCKQILPCGHQCSGKCGAECEPCRERCPSRCWHGACSKITCGEPCDLCMENCAMVCKHQQCNERCVDACTKAPCGRRCPRRTDCHHECASFCCEKCVCLNCDLKDFKLLDFSRKRDGKPVQLASKDRASKFTPDRDTVLMKIPGCGHVFTASQLDQHVREFDPDGSYYIPCPACPNKIQGIIRYNSQNKNRALRRENRKLDIISNMSVSASDLERYSHPQQRILNQSMLKALQCHDKFAAALKKIEKIHEHFNWAIEFNVSKWKNVILHLQIQPRVTPQFLEEISMEFHRLLICEEVTALRRMLDDAGYTLEEPLKSRCKIMKQLKQKLSLQVKADAESLIQDLYKMVSSVKGNDRIEQDRTELRKMSENFRAAVFQAQS